MTKLTETQTRILTAGAKRPGNIALPLPNGLAGAAAKIENGGAKVGHGSGGMTLLRAA